MGYLTSVTGMMTVCALVCAALGCGFFLYWRKRVQTFRSTIDWPSHAQAIELRGYENRQTLWAIAAAALLYTSALVNFPVIIIPLTVVMAILFILH